MFIFMIAMCVCAIAVNLLVKIKKPKKPKEPKLIYNRDVYLNIREKQHTYHKQALRAKHLVESNFYGVNWIDFLPDPKDPTKLEPDFYKTLCHTVFKCGDDIEKYKLRYGLTNEEVIYLEDCIDKLWDYVWEQYKKDNNVV